ncbi:formylglycine-generating enzyme family protein [Serratia sp. UGAL515B_01]|uniref:formylglycine-generating enzyme family protein n=1 Tax=Serratia sp. UGAL515B_01 TaxID=2986763 RepID=UPI0029541995|nr:formylglycine-generating enzyme family protein [Serratia sp. UGAL515B_01]WON77074.1 formylglycine-generating enzyme family protein [Serratia sp. UGAL515B_01]
MNINNMTIVVCSTLLVISGVVYADQTLDQKVMIDPAVAIQVANLKKTLKNAQSIGTWPKGFCGTLYGDIKKQSTLIDNSASLAGDYLLAYHAQQLAQQSAAMLYLCPDFESNKFAGGQLQNRYLRADMSLWIAQLDILTSKGREAFTLPSVSPSSNPATDLEPFDTFVDCKESYCTEMLVVPEGTFQMGGTQEEHIALNVDNYRADWESPRHTVKITRPFAIAKTEVTVDNYRKFINETGHMTAKGCLGFPGYPAMANPEYVIYQHDLSWENPGFSQTDQSPVTCVTRSDAEAYAKWLSIKSGATYRLPSEAEWEYAARAGTVTPYFWGNNIEDGCQFAAMYDLSTDRVTGFRFKVANCDDATPYTATVGSFRPNPWGLYDMTGNVREWVSDAWEDSYDTGPFTEKSRQQGVSQFPVLRGGAWDYMPQNQRIAYRSAYYSLYMRSNMWGFRLVREISSK